MNLNILVCFVLIFTSLSLSAADSFHKNWKFSKMIKGSATKSQALEVKVLERYTANSLVKTPMASSTFSFLPGYQGSESLEQIADKIKQGFGKRKLVITKGKSHYILSSYLASGNRIVRIIISKGKWGFYSYATMIRPGYYKSVIGEVKQFENAFSLYTRSNSKKKQYSFNFNRLSEFIISSAVATTFGGGKLPPKLQTVLTNGSGSLLPGTPGTNSATIGVHTQVVSSISPETLNHIDRIVSGQTTTLTTSLDANVLEVTDAIEGVSQDVTGVGNRALDMLEDGNSLARTAGKIGFATAVGATLGSMAVDLMITSVDGIAGIIWELLTDEKAEAARFKNFNQALELWEQANKEVGNLEKVFDKFLKSFEKLDGVKSEDLIRELNDKTDYLLFKARVFDRKSENDALSENCQFYYYKQAKEYTRLGNQMKSIVDYSRENGILSFRDLDGFYCEQLENIKRKLVNAELNLGKLRMALLNGERQYFIHQEEGLEKQKDDVDFYNGRGYKVKRKEAVKDYVNTIKEIAEDNSTEKRDKWVERCKESETGIGAHLSKQVKDVSTWWGKRASAKERLCVEAYKTMQNYYQDKSQRSTDDILKQAELDADKAFEQAKQRQLSLNVKGYARNASVMKNWFRKLELEAHCKNVLAESENTSKQYQICKKASPKLVNLSKSIGEAERNYNKKCEKRFDEFAAGASAGDDQDLTAFLKAQEFEKLPKREQLRRDLKPKDQEELDGLGDALDFMGISLADEEYQESSPLTENDPWENNF